MPTSPDWDRFIKAMDPKRFRAAFDAEATRAMQATGREVEREARKAIRNREFAPNAQATIDRKGSSTPLVDSNEMVNRIRSVAGKDAEGYFVTVGTNRKVSGKGGEVNIAAVLHEGVKKRSGGGWRIPPRPFLRKPAQSPVVKAAMKRHVQDATKRAMGVRP